MESLKKEKLAHSRSRRGADRTAGEQVEAHEKQQQLVSSLRQQLHLQIQQAQLQCNTVRQETAVAKQQAAAVWEEKVEAESEMRVWKAAHEAAEFRIEALKGRNAKLEQAAADLASETATTVQASQEEDALHCQLKQLTEQHASCNAECVELNLQLKRMKGEQPNPQSQLCTECQVRGIGVGPRDRGRAD